MKAQNGLGITTAASGNNPHHEVVCSAAIDKTWNTPSPHYLQAAFIMRRFAVGIDRARLIAELAFDLPTIGNGIVRRASV